VRGVEAGSGGVDEDDTRRQVGGGGERVRDARGLVETDGDETDSSVGRWIAIGIERLNERGAGEAIGRVIGGDRVRAVFPESAVVAVRVRRGAEIVERDERGECERGEERHDGRG